ncbi:ethanolamine ammonia-lyase light chain [Halanaerobium congolense]|uniref:Ethanolamine ammonia-lyase small subunit n=1 Tax=Halanaerobium congolense TaxID=54121 RepID=A0A4R8G5A8_9FIRM|nr:ethanolamine ammonia-lyase subunit EutC [Halanaerobium congolense]TDX38427.1 ethanolamine ammonia-lyase light chain [Halanaerobium congolense]
MISERDLRDIVKEVLKEVGADNPKTVEKVENEVQSAVSGTSTEVESGVIADITEVDLKKELLVPNPADEKAILNLKANTSARLGVWRTGPRYKTQTLLRFRSDHAAAMDAVFTDVSDEIIEEMDLFRVQTKCQDKDEFLTRPDLGRQFDEENLAKIKENCKDKPKVQIYVADGLSSTAIEANLRDVFPAIKQSLEGYNLEIGTPFFVKYGRVATMDAISECLDAEVSCVLIGERPGLATAESMSCYMAYDAKVGMPEANRTVISNIHSGGTPAVEAGAHIADVIKAMLDQKASGLDLDI